MNVMRPNRAGRETVSGSVYVVFLTSNHRTKIYVKYLSNHFRTGSR